MLDRTLLIHSISAINMVRGSVMFCPLFLSPNDMIEALKVRFEKGKSKGQFY